MTNDFLKKSKIKGTRYSAWNWGFAFRTDAPYSLHSPMSRSARGA